MANASNPWAPEEPSSSIYAEETWMQGELISNIAYGVELTLFLLCFDLLASKLPRERYKKQTIMLLGYITTIFALGTIFMGAQFKFVQQAFVENRNYPGGPAAFINAMYSITSDEISVVAFVIGNWLEDGFLVWRCVVIFQGCSKTWAALTTVLPSLMLCASFALGTTMLVQTSGSSPFQDVDIVLSYYVISLALNVIVTCLIVGRLLYYRRWMSNALGSGHASVNYITVSTILIESAALFSIFAILFLVPFGLGDDLGNVFLSCVSQIQTVASLLITYRVATGKAFTESTRIQAMTLPNAAGVDNVRFGEVSSSMQFSRRVSVAVEPVNATDAMEVAVSLDPSQDSRDDK